MKKYFGIIFTAVCLAALLVTSAAAATTGIAVDGKVYTFFGDVAGKTCAMEGKTFIFGEDTICVREDGKEDIWLALEAESDDSVIVECISTACTSGTVSGTVEMDSSVIPAEAVAVGTASAAGTGWDDDFARYAKFGLSYDTTEDILYYNGQRVRIFEDDYPLGLDISVSIDHFDPYGLVDIKAVHGPSTDETVGLKVLSDTEFAARDLTRWTRPWAGMRVSSAYSGTAMTEEEAKAFYAPYEEFGLTYEYQTNSLRLNGQTVREFIDIKKGNGEALDSGYFSGSLTSHYNDLGTIDVTAVRDYTRTDAQGYGTLTGLSVEPVE